MSTVLRKMEPEAITEEDTAIPVPEFPCRKRELQCKTLLTKEKAHPINHYLIGGLYSPIGSAL